MRTLIKAVLALLLVGLLLGGVSWGVWHVVSAQQPAGFRTAAVEKGNLLATISATGTIEPEEVIDVGAQVAAQIRNFGQDPSDSSKTIDYRSVVHPGTLLAQLDDGPFKARVDQAQAAVEVAQAAVDAADANIKRAEADLIQMKAKMVQSDRDFRRAERLTPTGAMADVDYDTAKATYETARANLGVDEAAIVQTKAAKLQAEKQKTQAVAALQEAQVNLGYTQIRSPVEGVIVDRRVNVGQTVVAGLNAPSLFLIAKDLKRLQVWASVNEADIGNIHPGQPVKFTVDAYPNEAFVGQVAQIRLNANMTQNVVTYTVVVSTDNSNGRLLPYMTANLQFEVDQRKDVLLVPNSAIRWKPQLAQVAPDARDVFKKMTKRSSGERGNPEEKPAPAREKESHDRGVVWMTDGSFVRPVKVRIGLTDGVQTEITEGEVRPGDNVVIGEAHAEIGDATSNPFTPKLFQPRKQQ